MMGALGLSIIEAMTSVIASCVIGFGLGDVGPTMFAFIPPAGKGLSFNALGRLKFTLYWYYSYLTSGK